MILRVPPMLHETLWAKLLLWLTVFVVLCAILYVIWYIHRIRRQQHETLEAYLELLNRTEAKDERRPSVEVKTEDDVMMKRIAKFVEPHLSDSDVNIGDMAAAAATSRSGLQRKMKNLLGVTPLDFLREARIKHACRLLRETDDPITKIAFLCGFSDAKYFSCCFKASVGSSPSDYRNSGLSNS